MLAPGSPARVSCCWMSEPARARRGGSGTERSRASAAAAASGRAPSSSSSSFPAGGAAHPPAEPPGELAQLSPSLAAMAPGNSSRNFSVPEARNGSAEKPAPHTNVIMPSLFSIICFLGIMGNLIVIFTIVKKKKLRCKQTVPDIFIFNLSIVDLLFLLGMPFLIHQLLGNGSWYFGAPLCTIITALDTNSQITSTNILTVMTLDRYLATVYPLKSTSVRTPCVAALVICLVWLLSFLTIIPVWMYAGLMPLEDGTVRCALLLPNPETDIYWFTLYQFMLAFAVPLVIICVVYFKILQHMATTVVPLPQRSLRVRTKKVTRMAVAICSAFFICWAPFYILQLVHLGIDTPSMAFLYAYNFAISLGYANSCLNPFLYIALSETFKRQFLVAIRPAKEPCRNSSSANNNSMTEASVCLKLASESTQQTQFQEDFSPRSLPVTVAVH
ncbi:melanin-concentrating hormone receptor 1 isoform X2 [Passer montanus]|uniref:melanin-concentrating hormone receptor 1 isoform X2 n=1 Tax=Passer montanus TaxID=9160 RepID=UPI0019619F42|nr:melanin-concentrating hormone receptor 1 isoform X2 [Passer montanus]